MFLEYNCNLLQEIFVATLFCNFGTKSSCYNASTIDILQICVRYTRITLRVVGVEILNVPVDEGNTF